MSKPKTYSNAWFPPAAQPSDDLRELMARWDEYRAKWIETYGTEEGFSEWFTQQVTTKS